MELPEQTHLPQYVGDLETLADDIADILDHCGFCENQLDDMAEIAILAGHVPFEWYAQFPTVAHIQALDQLIRRRIQYVH